jgi:hypothetical protein
MVVARRKRMKSGNNDGLELELVDEMSGLLT